VRSNAEREGVQGVGWCGQLRGGEVMNNKQLDDVSDIDVGETIEQRANRLFEEARKVVPYKYKTTGDLNKHTTLLLAKVIELAIAEDRETNKVIKWISVKDSLPLCWYENFELEITASKSVYVLGLTGDGAIGYGIGEYRSDGTWNCYGGDHDFMHIETVTHWHPFFDVPKAEVIE
ncbi:MAG: hypothetical protein Q7T48_16470, partial [Cellvibrio sp.]|uniref:hypothetical protein n=1 Tax=Cellvibrio sp. TaxID=1965322 RepID=UPI002724D040|nr:hypothetical protein [Cellvibrio sp.]